ncbi:MAG: response regulator [Candidatus Omnitrophota bacterium]
MAKLLIVDDDLVVRDLFERTLSKEGYEVFTAETGEQCLEVISNEGADNFAFVFLDLKMPGIGGENTFEILRRCYKKLNIIVISAYGMFCTRAKLIEKGNVIYLTKPFDMEYIKILVRNRIKEKI